MDSASFACCDPRVERRAVSRRLSSPEVRAELERERERAAEAREEESREEAARFLAKDTIE